MSSASFVKFNQLKMIKNENSSLSLNNPDFYAMFLSINYLFSKLLLPKKS